MGLLSEIQASLMQQGQEIGPILLKLRFLASRLRSGPLEEWVKHESEGYPELLTFPTIEGLASPTPELSSDHLAPALRMLQYPHF